MTPETVLSHAPLRLNEAERERFFTDGYLILERFAPADCLSAMQAALEETVARSAKLQAPSQDFSFDQRHDEARPRPSRLYRACEENEAFIDYVFHTEVLDVTADLVGPDVRYREAYINFKWPGGSLPVEWHQDFVFFPLTNRSMLTMVTYLHDVTDDMGPLMVLPNSHKGPALDHFEGEHFTGKVSPQILSTLALDRAVSVAAPAGTVIVFDGLTLHSSQPNHSDKLRPLLVAGYSAGDAFPYTDLPPPHKDQHAWQIVRGTRPSHAHIEVVDVRVPPLWTQEDFKPIFDVQKKV